MLTLGLTSTIHLALEPVDGRKERDALAGVVRSALNHDPTSGDLFVFLTRRGDSLKILAWMGDGFALYLRRLEQGTFAFPKPTARNSLSTHPTRPDPGWTRTRSGPIPPPLPQIGLIPAKFRLDR